MDSNYKKEEPKVRINPEDGNRAYRRWWKKLTGQWVSRPQDDSKITHKVYYVPFTRKSRAGVVYDYYKKIIDVIKK